METSAIVYDLDTSGSLMEQIQTLLASPKSEDGGKRSRKTQKENRRGGGVPSHDTCASCREGGDLFYCHHCPAAFHLQCCNPPLNEDMLPSGEWMCHRCVACRKKQELKKEQVNGLLEQASLKRSPSPELVAVRLEGAVGAGPPAAVAQVRLVERPATPASSTSTDLATPTPSEQNDADDEDLLDVEDETQGLGSSSSGSDGPGEFLRKPFALLIAAAMEENPTQFQLPSDLTCTTALPGTSRRRRKEMPVLKSVKRPHHDLDPNGLVSLPVKLCFACGRSCRFAPLIQCDFCPLLFHMDCTDPPLLAMPTGPWMCPKHKELLHQGSVALRNRCQLFDQFRDQVSQHAVKLDFLQLMHQSDWPYTKETHPPGRKALKVPKFVKSQYECPQTLAAPEGIRNGELIRNGVSDLPCQRCSASSSSPCSSSSPTQRYATSQAEQRAWLEDIISLHCSVLRHFSTGQKQTALWDGEPARKGDIKSRVASEEGGLPCSPDRTVVSASCSGDSQGEPTERLCKHSGGVFDNLETGSCDCTSADTNRDCVTRLPDHAARSGGAKVKPELSAPLNSCTGQIATAVQTKELGELAGGQPCLVETCGVSSSPAGIRSHSSPRSPQDKGLTDGKVTTIPGNGSSFPGSLPTSKGPPCSSVERGTDGGVDVELSQLDERFVKMLAWQRIQQLLQPKAAPPPTLQDSPSREASTQGRVRAAFYPLLGRGGTVNMCYRTLYIGTGADMDVCLTKYGHCNYVSGKHACIFYDENTKHYELLNYSEHGTTVDNVLYSCDFSEKTSPGPSGSATREQSVRRRRKRKQMEKEEDEVEEEERVTASVPAGGVMSSQPGGTARAACACRASSSSLIGGGGAGWEGTALLHHGSCVKLGCLQFVFSVAEFAHGLPKEEQLEEEVPAEPEEQGVDTRRTEPAVRQPLALHQPPVLCSNSVP